MSLLKRTALARLRKAQKDVCTDDSEARDPETEVLRKAELRVHLAALCEEQKRIPKDWRVARDVLERAFKEDFGPPRNQPSSSSTEPAHKAAQEGSERTSEVHSTLSALPTNSRRAVFASPGERSASREP